jgi:hypothetical protein
VRLRRGSLALPGRGGWSWSRGLLLSRSGCRLRDVHGRLDRRRMMLRLTGTSLRLAIREVSHVLSTGHIGLVGMGGTVSRSRALANDSGQDCWQWVASMAATPWCRTSSVKRQDVVARDANAPSDRFTTTAKGTGGDDATQTSVNDDLWPCHRCLVVRPVVLHQSELPGLEVYMGYIYWSCPVRPTRPCMGWSRYKERVGEGRYKEARYLLHVVGVVRGTRVDVVRYWADLPLLHVLRVGGSRSANENSTNAIDQIKKTMHAARPVHRQTDRRCSRSDDVRFSDGFHHES